MPFSRRSALAAMAGAVLVPGLGHARVSTAAGPLRIGVIGAGSLGGTVGRTWVRAGHEVMFASRHPESLSAMVAELGVRASAGTSRQAASFGSVLLFAVPYEALPGLGQELREAMNGKIVLDGCNPSSNASNELTRESATHGVAAVSARYLPGVRLVRAFSAVDATAVESSSRRQAGKLGVPLAADDATALDVAVALVRDAGCDPVVVGNLAAAAGFQRGGPGFRANTTADELRRLLNLPSTK